MDQADELDFRILRELWVGDNAYFRSDRVSLEAIGRAVGVHRSTVAARLDKWRESGAYEGVGLDVDPGALDLVAMHVHLHATTADLERAMELAALVDGVQSIIRFDRDWIGAPLMAPTEDALDRRVELLARLFEADERDIVANSREDFPGAQPVGLSPLDARILTALIDDARRTPTELSALLNVTPRTVERRLSRLREAGVHYMLPQVKPDKFRGMTSGFLGYRLHRDAPRDIVRRILAAVPDHVARQVEAPTRGALLVYGTAFGDLESAAKRVRELEGVEKVTLRVLTGGAEAPGWNAWLKEQVRRRARGP